MARHYQRGYPPAPVSGSPAIRMGGHKAASLSDYNIMQKLGQGSFGVVYKVLKKGGK